MIRLLLMVIDCLYRNRLIGPSSSISALFKWHVCLFLCEQNREWYSYHFPELVKIVNDNYLYAQVVKYIKSRKDLTVDKLEGLEELIMDEAKTKAIYDASRSSMGMKWKEKYFVYRVKTMLHKEIFLATCNSMALHCKLQGRLPCVTPHVCN